MSAYTVKIVRAVIVRLSSGPDFVSLDTELPGSTWPWPEANLSLKFECGRNTGPDYVKTHFPELPCEVIEAKR